MNDKLTTDRIDNHMYQIRLKDSDVLYVENSNMPMQGYSNHSTNWYEIRLTPKRAVMEMGNYRDNWGGTGSTHYGKVFLERQRALKLIERAREILAQDDSDDAEYDAMGLVESVEMLDPGKWI
jgi:hypothetical protein